MIYIVLLLLYLFSSSLLSWIYHDSNFINDALNNGDIKSSHEERSGYRKRRDNYSRKSFIAKKLIDFSLLFFIALCFLLVSIHSLFTKDCNGGKH